MPYQEVPDADKQQLYDAYNQGEDNLEVARVVGIKRNTAYHIFRQIEGKDRVISLPRDGVRRRFVNDVMRNTAIDIAEEHHKFTLL